MFEPRLYAAGIFVRVNCLGGELPKLRREELLELLTQNKVRESFQDWVELKETWRHTAGEDIAAIANNLSLQGGWLVVGVDDDGKLTGRDQNWASKTEADVSSQIQNDLWPVWAVKSVKAEKLGHGCCVLIDIENPGDVTHWKNVPYTVVGTVSQQMTPAQVTELSLRLPGADFSKVSYTGTYDPTLVVEYGKKVATANPDFGLDPERDSSEEILRKLNLLGTNTAGILFGNFPVRIVQFKENGDILHSETRRGLFHILSDSFVNELQGWTRRQGNQIAGNSTSVKEEEPYPVLSLREVLANGVAHAFYAREQGNVLVEMHPSRLIVQNNCALEAAVFVNKWFSRANRIYNHVLMSTLRLANITDELGTGKQKIFRRMIEAGKPEPIAEYSPQGSYGRWSITLYNRDADAHLLGLIERLKENFLNSDEWRIAIALLLWRKKKWSEIEKMLDEHYKRVAEKVFESANSPVSKYADVVIPRRWAVLALEGVVSRQFTTAEEEGIKEFLRAYSTSGARAGFIDNSEVRSLLGMSNSPSEVTQLSNLFRRWEKAGLVTNIKKGKWRFGKNDSGQS